MKKLIVGVILVILASVTYCQNKTDIDADKEAIIKMSKKWDVKALNRNHEANAEQYVDDAVRIGLDTVIVGKEAIRKDFKSYDEQSIILISEKDIEDLRISGDLAVARGLFSLSFVAKEDNEGTHYNGAWVDVYQRQQDGSWKSLYTILTEFKENY